MPNIEFGSEANGTPNGDQKSLIAIAKDINDRNRRIYEAQQKQKQLDAERAKQNAQNS